MRAPLLLHDQIHGASYTDPEHSQLEPHSLMEERWAVGQIQFTSSAVCFTGNSVMRKIEPLLVLLNFDTNQIFQSTPVRSSTRGHDQL